MPLRDCLHLPLETFESLSPVAVCLIDIAITTHRRLLPCNVADSECRWHALMKRNDNCQSSVQPLCRALRFVDSTKIAPLGGGPTSRMRVYFWRANRIPISTRGLSIARERLDRFAGRLAAKQPQRRSANRGVTWHRFFGCLNSPFDTVSDGRNWPGRLRAPISDSAAIVATTGSRTKADAGDRR